MYRYNSKVFSPLQSKAQGSNQMLISQDSDRAPQPSVFHKSKWPLILLPFLAAAAVLAFLLN